jgi:OmpR-family two-component system manganese-sensing sensor histidine kinase
MWWGADGRTRARRTLETEHDPVRWRSVLHSLRLRMALSHGGVLLLILVALGAAGQALLANELDRSATRDVEVAAAQEVDRLGELGTLSDPPDSDQPSRSPIRIGVFQPDGQPVDGDESVPGWLRPRAEGVVDLTVAGQPVRIVTRPVLLRDRLIGRVVAARSLAAEAALMHRVRFLLVFGGIAAMAASVLAGWSLAGRALRPVRNAYAVQASFAADASHELRTPLAFVRQGVEVLAEGRPALGRQVLDEVDYLTSLIDRLLQLARTEDGHLHLATRTVDVEEVCRRAVFRSGEAHGTAIKVNGPARLLARADPVALEAALDAVFENVAVHGGGVAEMRLRHEGHRAVIDVEDHGPGLTVEQRELAFRRFFRADAARSQDDRGAGLGLPIAQRLILAQAGSISLYDAPAGGLGVRLELPLDASASAGERRSASSARPTSEAAGRAR